MDISDAVSETALSAVDVDARRAVPSAAFLAVQRVQDLDHAVRTLRARLAAASVGTPQARDEILRLLTQVALFRIALADKTEYLENKKGST